MKKQCLNPEGCPVPIGPYSACVRKGNMVYPAGQIGVYPDTGELVSDDLGEQAAQALKNLCAALESAGAAIDDVVKANVYLTDMEGFEALNRAFGAVFKKDPPSRTCIAVRGLPKGAKVEIELVAVLG